MEHKLTVSAVISRGNQYLALRTTKDKKWGLPAGKVMPGENLEKALRREMKEEIGTCVSIQHIVGIYHFKSDRGNSILNVAYVVDPKKEPSISRPDEIESLDWFTLPQWRSYSYLNKVRAPKVQLQILKDYQCGHGIPRSIITDLFK